MIVIIDNYDSFTYNLAQYIGELGAEVQVFRNDAITPEGVKALQPSHIVISPGPGEPSDAGISREVIRQLGPQIPTLGVCLGHQCIGEVFGGKVIRAPRLMHGKTSPIQHNDDPLFKDVPKPFEATRYHSLIVEQESFPDDLRVTATTAEGEIMALRHREHPIVGVQFHPESVLTPYGKVILKNFLTDGGVKNMNGSNGSGTALLAEQPRSVLEIQSNTQPVAVGKGVEIGGQSVVLMAGPCSVESYEQTREVAAALHAQGLKVLRGGAFKPRTSPHSFQGLGVEGLEILRSVADEFGLLVITEALAVDHLPLVAEYADIVQIGSRNMQNFPLLWAAGDCGKPVLLKRGFMSTISEWLASVEHITSRGSQRIILCERGIRTFETATRNTLDTSAIALLKQTSPYPVIGDPSHATGRADLVLPAARSALVAGADGLIVEFHPRPTEALSDADQTLPLDSLGYFTDEIRRLAEAFGREVI
jgi:3-deoxy-7-phosphoheptulonate synthase